MAGHRAAADRVKNLSGSPTVSLMDRARRLRAEGRPVLDLSGGEPDFPTAPHIVQAAAQAMESGFTHYAPSRGIPELLRAIAHKFESENNVKFDPDKEILVTPGGKAALYVALQALLNAGDQVVLFDPCWVSYAPCVQLAGAAPVYVSIRAPVNLESFQAELRSAMNDRTRLLIVNTPNNPTGLVWTREMLQIVADAAQAHDAWVLSDEIYEKIIFDGRQHLSIASFPEMAQRTLVLNGLSKSHAMTGWRLGYVAGPDRLIAEMLKIYQHALTCATSFVQKGAVAALDGPRNYVDYMVNRYRVRRDKLVAGLNAIPGLECDLPEGAFYAFADITRTGLSDAEFGDRLLEQEAVAVTPGIAFGPSGRDHVRLSFANDDEMLQESVERIRRFATSLR